MSKSKAMGISDVHVLDNNDNNYEKIKVLNKELLRLAMEITDEDNNHQDDLLFDGVVTINKAIEALVALKELKFNKKNNNNKLKSPSFDHLNVPDEFRCPISKEIMKDPVVLATGQTYDRPFIHKWLKDGHRTCPQTQQVLSHINLTPNHLVRELISQWCKDHGVQLPPPVKDLDDGIMTNADRHHLNSLLDKLSSTLSEQKEAAREIRLLTKRMPSFRSFFGESTDCIPQLLKPLSASKKLDDHPDLQEDLVTVILNLSIHDNNKQLIGEHPLVIPFLVESLKRGTIDTRSNAAAALFTLSALDSNKLLIGKSAALRPLIDLIDEGHPLAMKDAASALFNLCVVVENRGRAVREGAVRVILQKIIDRVLVDELLSILAILATHQVAVEELGELGAVTYLLEIIRGSTCERNKENCIAIIHSMCINNRAKLKEVRDEEKAYCTISKLSENGTSRAKRKANSLLDRLYRGINLTHTA